MRTWWIHSVASLHLVWVTASAFAMVTKRGPASDEARARTHALAEAHYDVVWRVLRRLGLPPAQADDGAQQVFLIALQRTGDLVEGRERAFLCSTALWVGRRLRTGRAREELQDELPEVEAGSTPDAETELRRMRALLDQLLLRLDEEFREVMVLVELEGLSKSEVALVLGIPEGTVASRTRRAREKLEKMAREHLELEEER